MKLQVTNAIEELKRAFPCSGVTICGDGDGGAHVIVEDVEIGENFQPSSTWLGGHIPALYPYADIYPLFISCEVSRVDGVEFDVPITQGPQYLDRPTLQISRKNNITQHKPQTAVEKFHKVLHFLRNLQ